MRRGLSLSLGALGALGLLVTGAALAQRMDPRRPETVVVGLPQGPSPMSRVDARRTGQASSPLPSAPVRVAWKKSVTTHPNETVLDAPLVLPQGETLVVASGAGGGEAIWVAPDQTTRNLQLNQSVGPPALLADGTVVVVGASGSAIGFKSDGIKWHQPLGGEHSLAARIAPLALPDGGVAVATSTELTVLDSAGNVRARAAAPEPLYGPLLAARGKIYAVGYSTGVVYGWAPGRDMQRVGSFGGAIDGGAALIGDRTLVAMVDPLIQSRLVALDVETGVAVPRATYPQSGMGAYLGPPAVVGDVVYGLAAITGHAYVVALDAAGQEKFRVPIPAAAALPVALSDGGTPIFVVPPNHPGVIVDRSGAVAFASPDGTVGIVDASGAVSITGNDLPCVKGQGRPSAPVAGLASAGAGAFMVACASGTLARVVSGS